jgi:hypothetical protein
MSEFGAMRSAHCGSWHGLVLHRERREPPCYWCARLDPDYTPPGQPPPPACRYYKLGGVIFGTTKPSPALRALLAAGAARELTASEAQDLTGKAGE